MSRLCICGARSGSPQLYCMHCMYVLYCERAGSRGARIPDSAEQAETRQPKVKDRGHHQCSLRARTKFLLLAHAVRKLRLHYGDFIQENFNMPDKTAGKLETVLRVNKASAKVFEPRTS